MLAITLAAGVGVRMKQFTSNKPKTLLEFNGSSLLAKQQTLFKKMNITHYVVGGYKYELLNVTPEYLIVNNKFYETNMVYSLWCARDIFLGCLDKSDIIISYGDILYEEVVLEKLLNECRADIQICADKSFLDYWMVRMSKPQDDLESFYVDKTTNLIVDIGQGVNRIEEIEAQYIGLFKISSGYISSFLDGCDNLMKNKKNHNLSMTNFLQILIKSGCKAIPVYINSGWLEFDTDSDFINYNLMLNSGKLGKFYNA